jgi:hypothetical protein
VHARDARDGVVDRLGFGFESKVHSSNVPRLVEHPLFRTLFALYEKEKKKKKKETSF